MTGRASFTSIEARRLHSAYTGRSAIAHSPFASCLSKTTGFASTCRAILAVASTFRIARLVSLAELALSKAIDREVATSISKSRLDAVGLLSAAEAAGASQLVAFLRHFVASNFEFVFAARAADLRASLAPASLAHIEAHRWPPLEYLAAVETYEAAARAAKAPLRSRLSNCMGAAAVAATATHVTLCDLSEGIGPL